MKDNLYTLGFSLALGALCALLLTAAGLYTAPFRKANAEAETTRNILGVLGIPFPAAAPSSELLGIFRERVETIDDGKISTYRTVNAGAVAIPLSGPGLWGPIKGFLALEDDMTTIRGIAFHEQEETPGLGGEIASEAFRNRFTGKRIIDEKGNPGIRILRSGSRHQNEIDGITGATMTCDKVESLINAAIRAVRDVKGGSPHG